MKGVLGSALKLRGYTSFFKTGDGAAMDSSGESWARRERQRCEPGTPQIPEPVTGEDALPLFSGKKKHRPWRVVVSGHGLPELFAGAMAELCRRSKAGTAVEGGVLFRSFFQLSDVPASGAPLMLGGSDPIMLGSTVLFEYNNTGGSENSGFAASTVLLGYSKTGGSENSGFSSTGGFMFPTGTCPGQQAGDARGNPGGCAGYVAMRGGILGRGATPRGRVVEASARGFSWRVCWISSRRETGREVTSPACWRLSDQIRGGNINIMLDSTVLFGYNNPGGSENSGFATSTVLLGGVQQFGRVRE